jgi:hypothetical protein
VEPKPRGVLGLVPKPKSLGVAPLTPAELAEQAAIDADAELLAMLAARPQTRGDCKDGPRPCPWVSCRYHLALDITDRGAAQLRHPNLEVWEVDETCALDVADRGCVTHVEIGRLTNVSMQAAQQTLDIALKRIRQSDPALAPPDVSVERLRRIRRAAARRRETPPEGAEASGPWGERGRAPGDVPCPRCGRCVGAPVLGKSRFTHVPHRAPSGQLCRGDELVPARRAA